MGDSKIRTKKFLRVVQTQAKHYRGRLEVNRELIQKVFLEERRIELGRYRHGERFMSYDFLVSEIQKKWLKPESHGLAQEIIHSLSNRANNIIFECIIEVLQKELNKEKRRSEVLEILLEERTTLLNHNKLSIPRLRPKRREKPKLK